jgi:predicted dehydrogenase
MVQRYALAGAGHRGVGMFAGPLVRDYADVAELVALFDRNSRRIRAANDLLGTSIPGYTDFDRMIAEAKPDCVIVATMDSTHHDFVVRSLDAGCEAITEKPMAIDEEKVRAILAAEQRTGRQVRVSFNARYGAATEETKKLLNDGVIGDLISVDFAEYLDTSHGADYFRRWHRRKENSGGLLLHKASHHFDQLNWWIDSDPETVFAMGATRFYGPTVQERGERCLNCQYARSCRFYLDLRADARLKALYLDAEGEDGYYRDRCVFADEIDTEDTLVVTVRYANGVLLSYSLVAFSPYEGQRIGFNGTKGRIDVNRITRYHGLGADGSLGIQSLGAPGIQVNPMFGRPYTVEVEERKGTHGGSDERIRNHLFRADTPDPLAQRAGSRAGAMSTLVGAAANISMAKGIPVQIADLR